MQRRDGRLFERDRELVYLDELVRGPRLGEARLVLIEGPAGTGKSRLIAETKR